MKLFWPCLILFPLTFSLNVQANPSNTIQEQSVETIEQLYHKLDSMPNSSMQYRIDWFSSQFINTPYLLGSLGEGPKAYYDQYPLYRTDAFDCDTFVNTVLALSLSDSPSAFKQCMNRLRYQDGKVSYQTRNHFTSLDWNINNEKTGILKDITRSIVDENNSSIALTARALIDKPNWYAFKTLDTIRVYDLSNSEKQKRLEQLRLSGKGLLKQEAQIAYLPLDVLFNKKGQANLKLFAQIPSSSIIEIVRPNWDLRLKIGTCLNVSHLGFAIWKNKSLYFRHASLDQHKVVDTPLVNYLQNALKSPTIRGINLQIVIPASAKGSGCA